MTNKLNVLLAGRSKNDLDALKTLLDDHSNIALKVRHITNGHADPLHDVTLMPDVLILHLSSSWEEELKALSARPATSRPPMLAVGPDTDVRVLRSAMHAGARDVLTHPVSGEDLRNALQKLAHERSVSRSSGRSRLTAFINAKGGSGATLLASNVAHIMAARDQSRVAVLDMDLQFGTLPLYLDVTPKHGILRALEGVESLDAVALAGYMTKHPSGLHVLGTTSEQVVLPGEISAQRVQQLLDLARGVYQHMIVDLPRQIDPLTTAVMEAADRVAVVMQQSVAHVRDAKRLISVLKQELAMPVNQIVVIVNRYQAKSAVTIPDIEQALGCSSPIMVPNDFRTAADCVNMGTPLYELKKSATITKALKALAGQLNGNSAARPPGFFGRAMSTFVGAAG